jgi:hypothetical protein
MIFMASISATITITPQTQSVSHEFTITAKIGQQAVDPHTSTVPAFMLTSKKTTSQDGDTSLPLGCIFFLCKRVVTFSDVNKLADQQRPQLEAQTKLDLQSQEQKGGFMQLGDIVFSDADGTPTANPAIGEESKTVNVTLSEQGTTAALKVKDAHDLAVMLLRLSLPNNFTLIDQLTRVSQPVLLSISSAGDMKLAIAAGGVMRYQIPDTQVNDIHSHINGMKVKDVRSYLAGQTGLSKDNVAVHVSFGDTLPNNPTQINIITADPTNLPPVSIPNLPTATPIFLP